MITNQPETIFISDVPENFTQDNEKVGSENSKQRNSITCFKEDLGASMEEARECPAKTQEAFVQPTQ